MSDELTPFNLDERADAIISKWTWDDWFRFQKRWLHTLWPIPAHGTESARATIPLHADDDDIVLGRLIDYACEKFGVEVPKPIERVEEAEDAAAEA